MDSNTPTSTVLKPDKYNHLSKVCKALSSPKRLLIIDLICDGPKPVEKIANRSGMTIANTSQHLQTLLEAKFVKFEKKGLHSIYRLSNPAVENILHNIQDL